MVRSQSIARRDFLLVVLCDDGFACHSRYSRHFRPADAVCFSAAREIYHWTSHACRSGGALLALRGHRVDFSFSADVSGRTSIMEANTNSTTVYWRTCAALMALLAVTWGIAYVNLGSFNLVVALVISISKALLVALFFMHIKGSSRLLHLAATAGVIWLLILFSLTLSDYFSRGWVPLNH